MSARCPGCVHGGCGQPGEPLSGTDDGCRCNQMWKGTKCDDGSDYRQPAVIVFYVLLGLVYLHLVTFCMRQMRATRQRGGSNGRFPGFPELSAPSDLYEQQPYCVADLGFSMLLALITCMVLVRSWSTFSALYTIPTGVAQVLLNQASQYTMLYLMHSVSHSTTINHTHWRNGGIVIYSSVAAFTMASSWGVLVMVLIGVTSLIVLVPALFYKASRTKRLMKQVADQHTSGADKAVIGRCNRLTRMLGTSMIILVMCALIELATDMAEEELRDFRLVAYSVNPILDVFAYLSFWSNRPLTLVMKDHLRVMLCIKPPVVPDARKPSSASKYEESRKRISLNSPEEDAEQATAEAV